ncbi:CHRD domain-containing protein [Sphaerisporangium aureirubrum]|uniref:CHRD domain-containing protein n=1 Tax=Sphaerisporangium aureirubrum TaxID=1544736 RepID=A0ABW1NEG9_9ACTN
MKPTLVISGIVFATGLVAATLTPAQAQTAPAATTGTTAVADAYFAGWLTGRNEVPVRGGPAVGDRNGRAYVVIKISGDRVSYAARWSGIGTPTAFHIHKGRAGANGDVKIGFFGEALPRSARAVTGRVTVDDRGLLSAIRRSPSRYYVNVHTGQFPGGAVRAQLRRLSHPVDLTRVLNDGVRPRLTSYASGAQEVAEPGKTVGDRNGAGRWQFGFTGTSLRYAATWSRLAPVTNGHIHRGKKGVNGPVVANLFADSDGLPASISGLAGVSRIPRALARSFLRHPANWYSNIHTTEFPDGAIRGQLSTHLLLTPGR